MLIYDGCIYVKEKEQAVVYLKKVRNVKISYCKAKVKIFGNEVAGHVNILEADISGAVPLMYHVVVM